MGNIDPINSFYKKKIVIRQQATSALRFEKRCRGFRSRAHACPRSTACGPAPYLRALGTPCKEPNSSLQGGQRKHSNADLGAILRPGGDARAPWQCSGGLDGSGYAQNTSGDARAANRQFDAVANFICKRRLMESTPAQENCSR